MRRSAEPYGSYGIIAIDDNFVSPPSPANLYETAGLSTKKIKKKLGVKVAKTKITPWRFDVARNKSLNLVPKDYDICVCTDLDEVFEKGWRKKLEEIFNNPEIILGE